MEEMMRMVKDMWVVEKEKVREEEVMVMNNMEVMVVVVEEMKGWLLEEEAVVMNNMEVMVVAVEETKGWLLEEDR
jgi:hypothetical protein